MSINKTSMPLEETGMISRSCLFCGKKGKIQLSRDGKILHGWAYFGEINVASMRTSRYFYEIVATEPKLITKRMPNEQFDRRVKPKLIEYWECPSCFAKSKQNIGKTK